MNKSKEKNKQPVKSLPLNSILIWLVTIFLFPAKHHTMLVLKIFICKIELMQLS